MSQALGKQNGPATDVELIGGIGSLDSDGAIQGWCAASQAPFGPSRLLPPRTLAILVDGAVALSGVVCDLFRNELITAGLGEGCFGFSSQIPAAFIRPGESASVSLRDEATGLSVGPALKTRWRERRAAPRLAEMPDARQPLVVDGFDILLENERSSRSEEPRPKRSIAGITAASRTSFVEPQERDCLIPLQSDSAMSRQAALRSSVELVAAGRDGGVMIVGWADDADNPIDSVTVTAPAWRTTFDGASLARIRRTDVEEALQAAPYPYGFFGLVAAPSLSQVPDMVKVEVRLRDGGLVPADSPCKMFNAEGLRTLVLGYLAGATFLGNHAIEASVALEQGLGRQIVTLNTSITSRFSAAAHVQRFGARRTPPLGSIVVVLYGKPEFLFVQNALFAGRPGIEDYELVFVCNSPEMSEPLLAEAKAASMIYNLPQTIVLLPGNAGFGAANNAGVAAARGRRIVCINPDVFPRQPDWAARHTALLDALPADQTRFFGATLYYDDGSLMHGGMYFELDHGVTMRAGSIGESRLARVEHYGKGAPPGTNTYVRPRPVPALTGAFIASARDWYERIGGFNEDYIFGHYEDADLCLKSLARGQPAWLHDIKLWHLEGKGSVRKPHHEGGSLVNRWLFTHNWRDLIADGLNGPVPTHAALQPPRLERSSRKMARV